MKKNTATIHVRHSPFSAICGIILFSSHRWCMEMNIIVYLSWTSEREANIGSLSFCACTNTKIPMALCDVIGNVCVYSNRSGLPVISKYFFSSVILLY